MTPGRPASTSPWSRTRAAVSQRASRSSPRAASRTVASSTSSALPSRARASARRIALSLGPPIPRPYGPSIGLLEGEGVLHRRVGRAGPVARDDRDLLRLLEPDLGRLRAADVGRAAAG